jgi:serine/threonine protein kinase
MSRTHLQSSPKSPSESKQPDLILNPDHPENPSKLKVLRLIGKSRFPIYLVYSYTYKANFAMKVYPYANSQINPSFLSELSFSSFNHSNILSVYEARSFQEALFHNQLTSISYLLLEYAPFGDLARHISELPSDDKLARTFFQQILTGLEALHQKGMSHNDIKLDNLLISDDFEIKIADFDFCLVDSKGYVSGRGTKNFRPPELKQGKCENHFAADIFAAGICLFALKMHSLPYLENGNVAGINLYLALMEDPETFWSVWAGLGHKFDKDFKSLFEALTKKDPEGRIKLEDVKKMEWYKGPVYTKRELQKLLKGKLKPMMKLI